MPEPVYLCGPTASGKSGLALALAEAIDGEIVNADAFQLYRGAPVITAAPSSAEMARVPHHLYGVLSPTDTCDAMRYRSLALPVIDAIRQRGRVPVVTGGSGLYLKFLSHGPSPLPPGDPILRESLEMRSLNSLVEQLQALDPVEAGRTDLANRRYVTRALEICLLAGRPCSSLRDGWEQRSREIDDRLTGLLIQRERQDLHQRIDQRTRQMLEQGALEEVAALPRAATGLAKAIGVPQILAHLAGDLDLDACREAIAAATRRYAKRQETWFRRERWLIRVEWPAGAAAPVEAARSLLPNRL